jgi:hypothetical protein
LVYVIRDKGIEQTQCKEAIHCKKITIYGLGAAINGNGQLPFAVPNFGVTHARPLPAPSYFFLLSFFRFEAPDIKKKTSSINQGEKIPAFRLLD